VRYLFLYLYAVKSIPWFWQTTSHGTARSRLICISTVYGAIGDGNGWMESAYYNALFDECQELERCCVTFVPILAHIFLCRTADAFLRFDRNSSIFI
jgi:hypothetical protein